MKITDKYVFFYKDWLSNYERTDFTLELVIQGKELIKSGTRFSTTEQGFMYAKAMYFDDIETAEKILKTEHPAECRKLGRQVKNYDDKKWDVVRYSIFYDLNYAKYTQDKKLREKLLDPKFDGKIFVEASPIDRIWGIGYDEFSALKMDAYKNWGKNLLGKILTQIRTNLLS